MGIIKALRACLHTQSHVIKGTVEKIEKQYAEKSYFGELHYIEFTMKIRWWRKRRLRLWGDYIPVPLEEGKAYEIEYAYGSEFWDGFIRNITRI